MNIGAVLIFVNTFKFIITNPEKNCDAVLCRGVYQELALVDNEP